MAYIAGMMQRGQGEKTWFQEQREALGWSKGEVATAADVAVRTIYNAELGLPLQRSISLRIERALTKAALKESVKNK